MPDAKSYETNSRVYIKFGSSYFYTNKLLGEIGLTPIPEEELDIPLEHPKWRFLGPFWSISGAYVEHMREVRRDASRRHLERMGRR